MHFLEQMHSSDKEVAEKIPKIAQAIEEEPNEEPEQIEEEKKSEQGSFQLNVAERSLIAVRGIQTTDNKNTHLISAGNQPDEPQQDCFEDFNEDDLGIENENAQTVRMPHFGIDMNNDDFAMSRI